MGKKESIKYSEINYRALKQIDDAGINNIEHKYIFKQVHVNIDD